MELDVDDIVFVSKGMVFTLKRLKTYQEGEGRRLGIPPVRALRAWLAQSDITTGPLFRAIDRHGNIATTRLTDRTVARVIKRIAAKAGYDATYFSGHSLRAGLATSAAEAGKSERVIMATTGHRSEKMVRKYIREGNLFRDCASEGLL